MTAPLVELVDLTRAFPGPPEVQALKDVNLVIPEGDYVSIVGPSGSGKSTLLNILGLLDRPSVGEFRLAGARTGALGEDDRAAVRRVVFVFQSFRGCPTVLCSTTCCQCCTSGAGPSAGAPRRARPG